MNFHALVYCVIDIIWKAVGLKYTNILKKLVLLQCIPVFLGPRHIILKIKQTDWFTRTKSLLLFRKRACASKQYTLIEISNEAGFALHFLNEAFGDKKNMILIKLSTQALTSSPCMLLTRAELWERFPIGVACKQTLPGGSGALVLSPTQVPQRTQESLLAD